MTTYYVRKTGSDAAAGTSPATAWLTIDKAANTVVAGDIVWIGAGVYRELVTIDTSGTNGSEIEWRADIEGSQTGDAGLVIITALTDETGSGGTGNVLNLNGGQYNEFYDIIFGPSGTGAADITISATGVNSNYQGILFDTCTFFMPSDGANQLMTLNYGVAGAISGNRPTCRNCICYGVITSDYGTLLADVACGWVWENCVFYGSVSVDGPASASFGIENYAFTNCVFVNPSATCLTILDQWNTGDTGRIDNCYFLSNSTPLNIVGDGGTWNGDNNKTLVDAFSAPTGSNNTASVPLLRGMDVEHIYRKHFGWSPFAAHEPVWDINGSGYKSGGVDAGSATYAPATDMLGNARPMGTADDVGAVEANPRGARSSTWAADGSTYSMAFTSTGYHEFLRPVNAASTTITVKSYKSATYAGTAPKLEVLIGDTSQGTDSMTVGTETEETLSVNFTPSAAGWARVRVYSYATAGTVYFDILTSP